MLRYCLASLPTEDDVDEEEVYKMASVLSSCGGLEGMLTRYASGVGRQQAATKRKEWFIMKCSGGRRLKKKDRESAAFILTLYLFSL